MRCNKQAGWTLLEMLFVVALLILMSAMSIPIITSSLAYFRLQSAVAAVSGAVQTTRYQAISKGYPFQVTFTKADSSFQVLSDPTASGSFTVPAGVVKTPFSNGTVALDADKTFTFRPSGNVTVTSGVMPSALTLTGSRTAVLTVSQYGNITTTVQ